MDTKLSKTFGEDVLQYRLRTARQKKRMQYEDFDKQLIQLDKKRISLRHKERNLGWEPLAIPIQKGWKRTFVLREDVARSKQADFFEAILRKINTVEKSHKKDFKVKRKKRGRKIYVVKEQKLLEPPVHHFVTLRFNAQQQQLFHPVWYTAKWLKAPVMHLVFNEPWRFVLRLKPNMVTHVRVVDAELKAAIKKLDNYIDRQVLDRRIDKIKRGYYRYKGWKWGKEPKWNEKNMFKNKSLTQVIDMINET